MPSEAFGLVVVNLYIQLRMLIVRKKPSRWMRGTILKL